VHQDAERNYAAIAERVETVIEQAVRALVGEGERTLLPNAAPHPRVGIPHSASGHALPTTAR
jgi:alpha-mannosidase